MGEHRTPTEIITLLRLAARLREEGRSLEQIAGALGVSVETYETWRHGHGEAEGLRAEQLERLGQEQRRLTRRVEIEAEGFDDLGDDVRRQRRAP